MSVARQNNYVTILAEQTGTIKWFDTGKGYGFIVPDSTTDPEDMFVHIKRCRWGEGYPQQGDKVKYQVTLDRERRRKFADEVWQL